MKDAQHRHLRQYLLGQLEETEREALAERYFVDEDLFDELLEVENELFDQYARGALAPTESKQFAGYIHNLPDGVYKLAVARALASINPPTLIPETSAVGTVSWWQAIQNLWAGRQFGFQYALAAGALLIALGAVAYLWRRQPATETSVRVQVTAPAQNNENLQPPAKAAPEEKIGSRAKAVPSEQQEKIKPPAGVAQTKPTPEKTPQVRPQKPPAVATVATLILTPATLRSGGKPDVLALKAATETVALIAPIATTNGEPLANCCRVQINEGEKVVWAAENLKPKKGRIKLSIPVTLLTGSSYKLTVQGRATDGLEIVQEFYFEITKN